MIKFLKRMKEDYFVTILFVALGVFCAILLFLIGSKEPNRLTLQGYEYIDTFGQVGMAEYCYINYGQMICSVEGSKISVVEFKEVYETKN